MKNRLFWILFIVVFAVEATVLVVFAARTPDTAQDTVAVNDVSKSVTRDFEDMENHRNATTLDYVVLGGDGEVIYRTRTGLSESVNSAIAHRDTLLDVERNGAVVGKIIVYNDGIAAFSKQERVAVGVLSAVVAVSFLLCIFYGAYLYRSVIKPFGKLKGFAERVAGGNLEIPLEMDRHNIFGAFTESFDIMRSELNAARCAEAKARLEKKELVAKLSHDIKTPVASIKAVSEVGATVTKSARDRENYELVIGKADQINTLISNLFTATLDELQQLTVSPVCMESGIIKTLLENSDYLNRAEIPDIPQCLVCADRLRLQQVFDNIFANSYKYANTEMTVKVRVEDGFIRVETEDLGGGVSPDELAVLKEKYVRGSNSKEKDGAGLGLYISDYFMKAMGGALDVRNSERGLKVTVDIPLA